MEPTKTELLVAWMTLIKLRDSNVLDPADDQIVLSTLQIIDKEQSHMSDYATTQSHWRRLASHPNHLQDPATYYATLGST